MAAVLSCGEEAALSHRSAAELWNIAPATPQRIDVSVRRPTKVRRRGLEVRRRPKLRAEDIVSPKRHPGHQPRPHAGRLATELSPLGVERAINEADKRDFIDPEALRAALDRYQGEPGAPLLRRLLDEQTFRFSDSDLEILFRPIAAEAGLPFPLSKQLVNGWEVDFYWPDLGLVVETDGLRYHRTASTQARDARRDRAHALAGMTPLRFTHYEIKHEPAAVRAELSRAAVLLRKLRA